MLSDNVGHMCHGRPLFVLWPSIDNNAVVDPQLRVHGLTGLRIADASIMPGLIGGNTNAPTMMIAEKAVDMVSGRCRVPSQSTPVEIAQPKRHGAI